MGAIETVAQPLRSKSAWVSNAIMAFPLIQERNGFVVDNNEGNRVVSGVKVKVTGEVM